MAYVAITKNLIETVRNNINRLRNTEIGALITESQQKAQIVADPVFLALVIDTLWAPMTHLRAQLEPYNKNRTIRVSVLLTSGRDVTVEFAKTPVPCFAVELDPAYYGGSPIELRMGEDAHPKFVDIGTAAEALAEAHARWNVMDKQVCAFLKNCKSLNEAVKLWPDVVRYIDADSIERMNAKSERAKQVARGESDALAALKAIDMDAVHTSNVLARMAGATI